MDRFEITALGHRGDGIADLDGVRVHLPGTLPGEAVLRAPDGSVTILETSGDRVTPQCPHAGTCGGCVVQHAGDALVASWKRENVRVALAAQGLNAEIESGPVSEPGTRRRAAFGVTRTKKSALIGFRSRGNDRIIDMQTCAVLAPEIVTALPIFRALGSLGASRKGTVAVHVTTCAEGLDVAIDKAKPLNADMREAVLEQARHAGFARITWNNETLATFRPPTVSFDGAEVRIPPAAFLQATIAGERAIFDRVADIIGPIDPVADLFAGCGTFSLRLARRARVSAFEQDEQSISALDQAARQTTVLRSVTPVRRDLFRRPLMAENLARFSAVVIDPPRAGAEAQMRMLAASGVPVIASVSCDPASFARDARILHDGGYRIGPVTVIDQFRWSHHVEIVAGFRRPA